MSASPAANTGAFATEAEALDAVLRRMVDQLDPEAIWLFGSRAEGRHRPDSDFDLLVVTKREDGDLADDYDYVYSPVLGTGIGCDVLPCPIDDFIREMQDPTSMIAKIQKQGVRLYERHEHPIAHGVGR